MSIERNAFLANVIGADQKIKDQFPLTHLVVLDSTGYLTSIDPCELQYVTSCFDKNEKDNFSLKGTCKDHQNAEDIIDWYYTYGEDKLSACALNNVAVAHIWTQQGENWKTIAKHLIDKAVSKMQGCTENAQATIQHNQDHLSSTNDPLPIFEVEKARKLIADGKLPGLYYMNGEY